MRVFIGLATLLAATSASAQVYVHGYTKSNGTYVAPHYRSSPDSSVLNNWSTRGNVNPYTGQVGTKSPYSSYGNTYGGSTRSSSPYSCSYGCSSSSTSQSDSDDGDPY